MFDTRTTSRQSLRATRQGSYFFATKQYAFGAEPTVSASDFDRHLREEPSSIWEVSYKTSSTILIDSSGISPRGRVVGGRLVGCMRLS